MEKDLRTGHHLEILKNGIIVFFIFCFYSVLTGLHSFILFPPVLLYKHG